MYKTKKIKMATNKINKEAKKIFWFNLFNNCYKFICNFISWVWKWIKTLDVVGLVNLMLLVVIIVLCVSLIVDLSNNNKIVYKNNIETSFVDNKNTNKLINYNTPKIPALPIAINTKTNLKPQIKTVGVKKPVIVNSGVHKTKKSENQFLYGDVIIDTVKSTTMLPNGVNIEGNLFVQNMAKYTLPCGVNIKGNLFVRNVSKLYFCGDFTVSGNVYVNRYSSFGPIPKKSRIGGHVIL